MEENTENKQKFESIQALIRQLHGGSSSDLTRRQSNDETSKSFQRSASDRSVSSLQTLPIFEIGDKPRKRSMFDAAFRIPKLMITGPHSSPVESLHHSCALEHESSPHRRFSFGNFRRHSHSSVRKFFLFLSMWRIFCL